MRGALEGQRVLLVVPYFFGYERDIRNELETQGAMVDCIADRPFSAPTLKALTTLSPRAVQPFVDRLYGRLLSEFGAAKYDLVFVVNGQTLSTSMLRHLRSVFPAARFVLYLWDSIANRPLVRHNLPLFDHAYSFDPQDAVRYGMRLRPLFYGHGFQGGDASTSLAPRYKISFIGTAHSDRFPVLDRLRSGLEQGISAYWYLYLQAPWVLHYYRLTQQEMRHARPQDFSFVPLAKSDVESVFSSSLSILDIEHPRQIGLTMRTFETLGAHKKLITTNAGVRDYDFFTPANVCVIDRTSPRVPKEFFDSPYEALPKPIRDRYSISGWLREILSL